MTKLPFSNLMAGQGCGLNSELRLVAAGKHNLQCAVSSAPTLCHVRQAQPLPPWCMASSVITTMYGCEVRSTHTVLVVCG